MEWTFIIYTTLVLVSISPVSTEIPSSPSQRETKVPTTTNTITLTDVTTTQSLNNVSTQNSNIIPHEATASPLPPKTTTTAIPLSTADPTSKGIVSLSTSPAPQSQTLPSSTTTTTTLSSSTTTTTRSSTTSNRQHHGKKILEDDIVTSIVPEVVHYHSSPHLIDTINQQIVDVPEPKEIGDVTQTEAPTSKSSLFAGLIFGSLLSLALGFLIYKRLDSARRRREYRRMNDYLIDGMYNDI